MAYMRLGDLLVAQGVITEEQLSEALALQKGTNERLGNLLIENNFITEKQLIEALEIQLGVDYINLDNTVIPVDMAKYVPKAIAVRHNMVPVKLVRDELYIAMSDPLDFVAQEEVKTLTRKQVIPMISTRSATEKAIMTLYDNEGTARVIEEMKREAGTTDEVEDIVQEEDPNDIAPTIRFVNSVIEQAFTRRASDIHLEPQDGQMLVRMRIDGLLQKVLTVPSNLQNTVISRLKVMGGMNISEHKIPQDGHAMMNLMGHNLDLRISSIPTVYGEKIVMRLLDKTSWQISKQSIGLTGSDLDKYEELLKNSSGVILLVGPTGSGKSTTMCAMLQQLATEEVNVVTLEDPVEYNIPGISQCQINEKTGMTFAAGLRAILRQDPDIISVGEIRDGETATIAIRAAITGHLVISTLHTNDAVSAVHRLEDIGVERYLISGSLRGVISQRLVRKICPHCREAYSPDDEERRILGIGMGENVSVYRGKGCSMCNNSGYSGRRAVFEILMVNSHLRDLINKGSSDDQLLQQALKDGHVTMQENCRSLVLNGITTPKEAMKAIHSTSN